MPRALAAAMAFLLILSLPAAAQLEGRPVIERPRLVLLPLAVYPNTTGMHRRAEEVLARLRSALGAGERYDVVPEPPEERPRTSGGKPLGITFFLTGTLGAGPGRQLWLTTQLVLVETSEVVMAASADLADRHWERGVDSVAHLVLSESH